MRLRLLIFFVFLFPVISKSQDKQSADSTIQKADVKKYKKRATNPESICNYQYLNLDLMRANGVKQMLVVDNMMYYMLTMKLDTLGRVIESKAQSIGDTRSQNYSFFYADSSQTQPSLILFNYSDSHEFDTVEIKPDTVNYAPLTKSKYRWSKNSLQKCRYLENGLIHNSIEYACRFWFFKHPVRIRVYFYEYHQEP